MKVNGTQFTWGIELRKFGVGAVAVLSQQGKSRRRRLPWIKSSEVHTTMSMAERSSISEGC